MQANVLFSSFKVGALSLPNRFVMAPLTRGRAEADGTPSALMADYYVQRASAGLIVSEATAVSPLAVGWVGAPRIYNASHARGWGKVTDALHRAGGRIFLQLWHMGRVSHPDFLNGQVPVGPSAIAAAGDSHTATGHKPYVTPHALEAQEIPGVIRDYAYAARLAREAGFDGVELHGANGYLIDQFLRDGSNQRKDAYGGSAANRARFLLEVTEAVASAWAPERVGVRLSPTGAYNDMRDSNPVETFTYAAQALNRFGLAYLHVMEGLPGHWAHVPGTQVTPHLRAVFKGPMIVNGGYDAVKAAAAIEGGQTDLVAFGVPFLANPDFPERIRHAAALNAPDMATFYTGGARGYTDYPALASVPA